MISPEQPKRLSRRLPLRASRRMAETSTWSGRSGPGAAKFPQRRHLFGACQGTIEGCGCVVWSGTMMTDLQTKVEKYEIKAAQCEEWVRQATDAPQRAFYEVLARYYAELATDFRRVIEKRKIAYPGA